MRKVIVVAAPSGTIVAAVTVPKQVYERSGGEFQRLAQQVHQAFNQTLTVHDEERCSTFAAVERTVRRLNGGR